MVAVGGALFVENLTFVLKIAMKISSKWFLPEFLHFLNSLDFLKSGYITFLIGQGTRKPFNVVWLNQLIQKTFTLFWKEPIYQTQGISGLGGSLREAYHQALFTKLFNDSHWLPEKMLSSQYLRRKSLILSKGKVLKSHLFMVRLTIRVDPPPSEVRCFLFNFLYLIYKIDQVLKLFFNVLHFILLFWISA